MVILRADFYREAKDKMPFRSMIISANTDDEVLTEAEAQMGDAARVQLFRSSAQMPTSSFDGEYFVIFSNAEMPNTRRVARPDNRK